MYTQLLRTKGVAVGMYVGFLALLAAAAVLVLGVLVDHATTAEAVLMCSSFAVAALAGLVNVGLNVSTWVVGFARDALEPDEYRREWLPRSGRRVVALHWRYARSGEAAREVFRTLVADSISSGSHPDAFETLEAARSLVSVEASR